MPKAKFADLKEELSKQHNGDTKQLEVIFSDSRRLIVEAPAGYGKTTTMISRIAFLFASGSIPNPKRILALTFSVNAALKVKREVAEKLPKLMGAQNNPNLISEKVYVTNYHGFCRGVLKRYGYLISDALRKDVRLFKAVDDSDIRKQQAFKNVLSATELQQVEGIENSIKSVSMPSIEDMHEYNKIIINKLLPLDYITHNSVILFTLEIFNRFPEIIKFYRSYYPLIIVDEFQDTNCIAWALLEVLISNHTQLLFLGDPLQRIYGFIGALPDIMSMVTEKYNMTKVVLEKNYRFGNNPEMLKLDSNVRENAATYFAPILAKKNVARLPAFWCSSQQEEAQMISAKVQSLISKSVEKVAILFTRRGKNAEIIESELSNDKIPYFYGMFTDDDIEYVDFHIKCQEMFIKQFGKTKNISKKALSYFVERIKEKYCSIMTKTVNSLL